MNQRRVHILKKQLIELLGESPTLRQWRAWKKRREAVKNPAMRFFREPENDMTIEYLPEKGTQKESLWRKVLNFIKRLWKN